MLEAFGAFFASIGYAVIFNIDRKYLFFAGICGASGTLVYDWLNHTHMDGFMVLFISAALVSIIAEVLARIYRTPVTTFSVCGIIPLVPGGTMYFTMLEMVEGNSERAFQLGFEAISYAGAIALAIIIVSSIVKTFINVKNRRKMVR